VLASGPFYESGTFWGAAAAVAAFATLVVSVILWRLGGPRRLLTYSMPVTSPLLSQYSRRFMRAELKVTVGTTLMKDPYVVILRMGNRSRRDIRSRDFDQDKPIVFDLGAEILAVGGPRSGTDPPETLTFEDTKISYGPALIHGGQNLRLTILTDGAPNLKCEHHLVNVIVREVASAGRRPPAQMLVYFGVFIGALALVTGFGWIGDSLQQYMLSLVGVVAVAFIATYVYWRIWERRPLRQR
jgi:hypothetical protein